VLALSVSPDGAQGLAVGGETGNANGTGPAGRDETAAAMSFGPGATTTTNQAAPIASEASQASFVLAAHASCMEACASQANDGFGPDVQLAHAVGEASQVQGARAFLYAGGRFDGQGAPGGDGFIRELNRFAALLGSGAGSLPVYAAASGDLAPSGVGVGPFVSALGQFVPAGRSLPGTDAPPAGTAAYAFQSAGSSGLVDVIVLDYSQPSLGTAQLGWLAAQLAAAKQAGVPALVMGNDALGSGGQSDAASVSQALVQGGASAYLFDSPGANVQTTVSYAGRSIPAFGTGTLGSIISGNGPSTHDGLGSSAFLLISVDTAARNAATNVAPVTAQGIPNIGQLAMHATDGTLLRRSQVALFDALARRPLGGSDWYLSSSGSSWFVGPGAYDPIPSHCAGPNCAYQIPEQVTYSSSQRDIGDFVAHDTSSSNSHQVALGSGGKPIADSSSGLFCAYNAGTTTVTVTAGGLSYSLPVTVQQGSVRQPCGTVPLLNPPNRTVAGAPVPPPPPAPPGPAPANPAPVTPPPAPHPVIPPAPVPHPAAVPAPVPHPALTPVHHSATVPAPFPVAVPAPAALVVPVIPLVPPPATSVPQPIPPSGTAQVPSQSPVSQNVVAAERQREEEAATQVVHHAVAVRPIQAAASRPLAAPAIYQLAGAARQPGGGIPAWMLALLVPAALSAAAIRRRGNPPQPAFQRSYTTTTRQGEARCQRRD
jgi:hypothetical protein